MTSEIFKIVLKEVGWILLGLLLTFLMTLLFLIILTAFGAIRLGEPTNLQSEENSAIAFLAAFFAQNLAFLFLAIKRGNIEGDKLVQWTENAKNLSLIKKVGLGVVTGIILLSSFYLQQLILNPFFSDAQLTQSSWSETQVWGLNERIILFIWGALFAPIVEELYFREAMFGSIHRKGFPNFAMFFSCAVFGIIHLNFIYIFGYLIYGIGLTLLYKKTRSLIPSITAHITINSIALWLILFT